MLAPTHAAEFVTLDPGESVSFIVEDLAPFLPLFSATVAVVNAEGGDLSVTWRLVTEIPDAPIGFANAYVNDLSTSVITENSFLSLTSPFPVLDGLYHKHHVVLSNPDTIAVLAIVTLTGSIEALSLQRPSTTVVMP